MKNSNGNYRTNFNLSQSYVYLSELLLHVVNLSETSLKLLNVQPS